MKRIWLALWLLSQSLGFALPARPNVAGQDPPRRLAWEQNQGGHHGYDTGDQSCGIYAAELPSVTTENLIDRASAVPKSVGYDSYLVSTIRSVGGPRAPPAENFGSLAAKETPRVLTQAEQALYGRVTQTKGFRQQDGAGRRSGRSLGATSLIQGLGQGKATTYSCGGTNASVSTSIWFSNPTNASAAVTYDADGNVTSRAWTGTNAKSQVLEWDPFGLRQFDSSEGRFLSADPLGHSGSLSLYDYAYNDPVNWVDADGRFGKGIGVGARDMAVGFWDLFYNVGGSFEYAMTGDDAFAEQWAGLKGVGYGLAQLGSDLWNGNLGDVGRALTGGEGRSGGFRTGYGGFQIATFYLSGAKLGQLGRVGEVAEVGVNVTRAGEAGSALKVATQAFEKGGGWGYPRNALLSPNAEAGGIGAAAESGALRIAPYGELSGDIAGQAHHLNQTAAFRDVIPRSQGLSIELQGNVLTDAGAPHTLAHQSLEGFWNTFRGTEIVPSNLQYTRALQQSLRAAGLPETQVQQAVRAAIRERVDFGLLGGMEIPRVPGPIRNLAQ